MTIASIVTLASMSPALRSDARASPAIFARSSSSGSTSNMARINGRRLSGPPPPLRDHGRRDRDPVLPHLRGCNDLTDALSGPLERDQRSGVELWRRPFAPPVSKAPTFETKVFAGNPMRGSSRSPKSRGYVVVTADVEFGNELVYPPETHHGVVLARLPVALPGPMLVRAIVAAITALAAENLVATLVVIEPGRIRIRRSSRSG